MAKEKQNLSIGEMAKLNNTTVPTLRLYDELGLLKPIYIDESSHYRYYDIKQNARFDMIQYMKELGMELKEIKEVLDAEDLELIEAILIRKKEQNLKEIKHLQIKQDAINRTIESGMYACIYLDDFNQEQDYAKRLFNYCNENKYQICGDYLCEVLTEFNVFGKEQRSMFLRLQVPVRFKK